MATAAPAHVCLPGHAPQPSVLSSPPVKPVLYDITPSGTYKQRDVPPSPKVHSVGSGDAGAGDAPLMQRLQDFLGVAGLVDLYEHQQQHVRLRQQSGSGRVGYSSSARQARPGSRTAPQAQQGSGATPAAAAAAGPRPYFWRLQQRLQAGGYRPGSSLGAGGGGGWAEAPVSDEDYALLFRRQVYDNVSGVAGSLGWAGRGGCARPA